MINVFASKIENVPGSHGFKKTALIEIVRHPLQGSVQGSYKVEPVIREEVTVEYDRTYGFVTGAPDDLHKLIIAAIEHEIETADPFAYTAPEWV